VPPPTNSDVATRGAIEVARSISSTSASTYDDCSPADLSVQVANAQ
jgi:hypothetical protein